MLTDNRFTSYNIIQFLILIKVNIKKIDKTTKSQE